MNTATVGAAWLVVQCIWSPQQETKCEFIHVKDPSITLQSKEWRAGYEGPFDTEDECRARIKTA
jgi:hypothetical protein